MTFDKLTIKAQQAVQAAADIAQQNGQQSIEPVHLLAGISEKAPDVVKFLFQKLGINPQQVDTLVRSDMQPGSHGALKICNRKLDSIAINLVPKDQQLGAVPLSMSMPIGGYSLAGLFALWAAIRTDVFSSVAAASPSVWFPGWMEYVKENPIQAKAVFLSLGDREERAKNPLMATVGDCIREQYALLQADHSVTLEWNPGNHFQDSEKRTARAFCWIAEQEK
jgi:hypothetical protein